MNDRPKEEPGEVTRLLHRLSEGDSEDRERLMGLVYQALHNLAQAHLKGERQNHTLQPTALVHEAYLKLVGQQNTDWKDRGHFMSVASQAIRRILVDHARARNRLKRGGDAVRVTLKDGDAFAATQDVNLLDLDQALEALEQEDALDHQIVMLKFFGGLAEAEIARALDIGERTVRRRWAFTRSWLFQRLSN